MAEELPKVAGVMASVARRMLEDFEASKAFRQHGDKGDAREAIVRDILQRYLPGSVRITSGKTEVVDSVGNCSGQRDIAIVDPNIPALHTQQDVQLLPVESVRGIVEVKTNLTPAELVTDLNKLAEVKRMEKRAYRPGLRQYTVYGETTHILPTYGHIFAFSTNSMDRLLDAAIDWCKGRPLRELPDSIWVLGAGGLVWVDDSDRLSVTPERGCHLGILLPTRDENILLQMLMFMISMYSQSSDAALDLTGYMNGSVWATMETMSRQALPFVNE